MAELLTKEVLFPGKSELDQVGRIMALLGPPTAEVWPSAATLPHINKARAAAPCAGPAAGQATSFINPHPAPGTACGSI